MVTSNRSYNMMLNDFASGIAATGTGFFRQTFTVLVDMDAADTATVKLDFAGSTKVVDLDANNYFMGRLVG